MSITSLWMYLFQPDKEIPLSIQNDPMTSHIAEITRDKESKIAYLKIDTEGKWKLFSGPSVKDINMSTPILKGKGSGTFRLQVPTDSRSYFMLMTGKENLVLAERHLPMEGGFNFRDLGGIKAKDGRVVKWGQLFRSDDLHNLTDDDLNYLSSIPIMTVVDFRSEQEIEQAPDRVPSSARYDYPYSITPGNLTTNAADLSSIQSMDMDSVMRSINELLVSDPSSIKRYKDFFALLQQKENTPLLFHCTAGKDRTGMGAALILYALGVDEDTIMKDYLLSNKYITEKYSDYIKQYPSLTPLFEVRPQYLSTGIQKIKQDYGTVDNYLERVLNVDIPHFREMYLY